jgi:hypothetical protein
MNGTLKIERKKEEKSCLFSQSLVNDHFALKIMYRFSHL